MHPVCTYYLGGVAALVAEHHLDAAIGAFDYVVVGEHVAGTVEDEAGALAVLGNRAVKEVEDQGGGGDVDDRGKHALVDGDIVLLLGVVGGSGFSLGERERGAGAMRSEERDIAQGKTVKAGGEMRGDEPESAYQENDQKKAAQ